MKRMETFSVGQKLNFPEYDGVHQKKILNILWSESGKGDIFYPKKEVLTQAAEWSIFLFDDGTYLMGNEIPKQ